MDRLRPDDVFDQGQHVIVRVRPGGLKTNPTDHPRLWPVYCCCHVKGQSCPLHAEGKRLQDLLPWKRAEVHAQLKSQGLSLYSCRRSCATNIRLTAHQSGIGGTAIEALSEKYGERAEYLLSHARSSHMLEHYSWDAAAYVGAQLVGSHNVQMWMEDEGSHFPTSLLWPKFSNGGTKRQKENYWAGMIATVISEGSLRNFLGSPDFNHRARFGQKRTATEVMRDTLILSSKHVEEKDKKSARFREEQLVKKKQDGGEKLITDPLAEIARGVASSSSSGKSTMSLDMILRRARPLYVDEKTDVLEVASADYQHHSWTPKTKR